MFYWLVAVLLINIPEYLHTVFHFVKYSTTMYKGSKLELCLTLSWRRSLSYRNQSINPIQSICRANQKVNKNDLIVVIFIFIYLSVYVPVNIICAISLLLHGFISASIFSLETLIYEMIFHKKAVAWRCSIGTCFK